MLKKVGLLAVMIGVLIGAGWSHSLALGLGGVSYNIGPGFSLNGGVSFSMRDVHVIEQEKITDEMTSSRFLLKADVAPVKYVDIYGLGGVSDLQLDDGDFEGTLGWMWGAGLRPQLFPLTWSSPVNITLDAQYMELYTRDDTIDARMSEIQGSLIVAYVMRSLAPYGGVKYDHIIAHFEGAENDLAADLEWGIFIGCDYFVTQNVFFNLELSIFSETAFYLAAGYKY